MVAGVGVAHDVMLPGYFCLIPDGLQPTSLVTERHIHL